MSVNQLQEAPRLSSGEVQRNKAHAYFLAMEHDPTLMPPVEVHPRARLDVTHATFNKGGHIVPVRRWRRHRRG